MKLNTITAIFKFTLLEVVRTRLGFFAIAIVATVYALAEFSASLAITESFEYRVVTYATIIRLIAVFIVALFVTSSVIRDFDDGLFELLISRPVSRVTWYMSKQLGYFVAALLFSIICVLPLVYFVRLSSFSDGVLSANLFIWWLSCFAELCLVVAASMALAITLRNTTIGITGVLAFYVLSRTVSALVLMSARAAEDIGQAVNQLVANGVQALAYLLPDLSRFANPAWLLPANTVEMSLDAGFTSDIHYVLVQTLIYCLVLSSIGLFDLYRRNV